MNNLLIRQFGSLKVVCIFLCSLSTFAQNTSSITKYSGPNLTFSPPKGTPSYNVISSACDAPLTLTQSTSQTITSGNSVSCSNSGFNLDNSYWRAFTLAQPITVTAVEIGIQQASAPTGTQSITVNIYENTGGVFPAGTKTLKGTATANVLNQALTILSVPISASLPANAQMVLEVFTPSGLAAGNKFFIGSNSLGQTSPGYLSSDACEIYTPVTFASINFPNVHLVMNVIACESPDIYVDAGVGSGGNGSSWYNAYNDLQVAMDAANSGDVIWVAKGTYKPTKDHTGSTSPADPRDKNFHLAKDLKIYGGFFGYETLFSQRDPKAYETILSGDFNGNDVISGSGATLSISDTSENAYHVLILANLTSNAVIDGLTIKGGNASGPIGNSILFSNKSFSRAYGGGINTNNSSPRFANLIISGNGASYGAGMYAYASSPNITSTLFKLNLARITGGGLNLKSSAAPTINNSVFTGNKTVLSTGGAISNNDCNTTVTNSTFVGNSSASQSAGIMDWNRTQTLTISNCIFWDNTYNGGGSSSGVDIYSVTSTPTVSDCITQYYSSGTNLKVGQNPYFKDASNLDFRINPCSPAINTGNNTAWNVVGLSTDFSGNPRPFNGTVDMGAFESQKAPFLSAAVIHVKYNALGNNSGTSFANAFTNLQDALDNQCGNLDIWVAAGTYKPTRDHLENSTPSSDRLKTFHLKKDMNIYGGFAGTETTLSERNWLSNITTLSGDFMDDDVVSGAGSTLAITVNTENAYHVLITANLTDAAIIDGFTIKGGNLGNGQGTIFYASKAYTVEHGAGMYNIDSSPNIRNIIFTANSAEEGGGMKNENSSPILNSVTFNKNLAETAGGGLYNHSSAPVITNTIFSLNKANFAGGLNNYSSSPSIINVTFSENAASYSAGGGGMFNQLSSSLVITNSIFWNNTQGGNNNTYGADINGSGSAPTITYSLTQESSFYSSGTGIINNQDPQFVDAANGDLRLSRCSSAINTGDNAAWTATGLSTDLAGNDRPFGTSVVDMGAYEFQGNNQFTNAIYVKHNANGDNDGSTWANAYTDLQDAMDNECGSLPIWVAAGTYLPKDAPDGTTSTGFTDRNNAFHLATDMKIYGGFKGTETLLSERDWKANLTNLSGDFNEDDIVSGSGATLSITNNTENAYHILITANLTSAAIIDGFYMKAGNTDGVGNIVFSTRTFSNRFGGGMFNNYSNPTISNTTFQGNSAASSGGGMYNESSSPIISNTTFQGNSAYNDAGMYNNYSSTTIRNTIFQGNLAYNGGGMHNNTASSTSISNATFQGNSASNFGGGMYNIAASSSSIVNSIFWGNMANSVPNSFYNHYRLLTISHSLIPEADSTALSNNSNGGILSINNMVYNQNPQFVDAANGFLQLKCYSPAINAGTASGAPTDDITGFTRVGLPDMGAYEYGQAMVDIQIADGTNPNLSGTTEIIASSQILNTNNVLYQGSNNVQLLHGFSVAPTGGAATVFRAEIGDGCERE